MRTPETRQSLLLQLQDLQNQEAWSEFVAIYQPLIEELARTQGVQPVDAAEIAQVVLLAVAKAAPKWDLEPIVRFRAWLRTATRNVVVNFLIQQSRQPKPTGDSDFQQWLEQVPVSSSESGLFAEEERRRVYDWAVERARAEFEGSTWQAFWKTAVEGSDVSTAARELQMSAGAIYVARSRVLNRLREKVQELMAAENL